MILAFRNLHLDIDYTSMRPFVVEFMKRWQEDWYNKPDSHHSLSTWATLAEKVVKDAFEHINDLLGTQTYNNTQQIQWKCPTADLLVLAEEHEELCRLLQQNLEVVKGSFGQPDPVLSMEDLRKNLSKVRDVESLQAVLSSFHRRAWEGAAAMIGGPIMSRLKDMAARIREMASQPAGNTTEEMGVSATRRERAR